MEDTQAPPRLDAGALRDWLISYTAQLLGLPGDEIDPAYSFELYGLDSSAAVGLSGDLGDLLGIELETSVAYDFPTIDALVEHLVSAGHVTAS